MHTAFNAAHRLAPKPESRETATVEQWVRYHAATALAAYADFDEALKTLPRNPERGSRPDIGYLVMIGSSATAAALALVAPAGNVAGHLWDLSPDAGALNGEYVDWLTTTLDGLGINPADIDPEFNAADFRSASQPITEDAKG